MPSKRTQILEIHAGVGKVYRGDREIARGRYELVVEPSNPKDDWGQIAVIQGEWSYGADGLLVLPLQDG
jgi:hypothetical protein